jgi:hypothetical protein
MKTTRIHGILGGLAKFYDACSSEHQRHRIESWTLWLAIGGFLIHLALIAMVRSLPSLQSGFLEDLDRNYLHAVYTPFSFILFYEVLLLVFALPRSHTRSIAMQYEILSLIIIRRVFKDIGEFRDPATWLEQKEEALTVVLDMLAALLMFLLIAVFRRVNRTVQHAPENPNLVRFVAIKKSVAVLLLGTLLFLAAYNVLQWLSGVFMPSEGAANSAKDLDYFFFPMFFEFMIFTDIFLLIVSTPQPYDLLVGLTAILYGLGVLSVFSYSTRIQSHSDD